MEPPNTSYARPKRQHFMRHSLVPSPLRYGVAQHGLALYFYPKG